MLAQDVIRKPPRTVAASCLSIEPEILQAFIQLSQPPGVVGDGLTGFGERALCLVAVPHDHIGADQPQPSLDVVAVLLQPAGEAFDHATDHRAAVVPPPDSTGAVEPSPRARAAWTSGRQGAAAGAFASMARQIEAASAGRP